MENGTLPLSRALVTTQEEKLIRELILQLKLGRVSTTYFEDKFGIDLARHFKVPLDALCEHGYLEANGDFIILTRDALLRVDSLLHSFFLPEHQNARYT